MAGGRAETKKRRTKEASRYSGQSNSKAQTQKDGFWKWAGKENSSKEGQQRAHDPGIYKE